MPIPTTIKRLLSHALVAVVVACGVSIDAHANGHCQYKELSPWTKKWYSMCKMPSTAKSCDDWAMREGISATRFADGDCPTGGVVGACVVGGVSQYFYQMSATTAAAGCTQLNGQWQPSATPSG